AFVKAWARVPAGIANARARSVAAPIANREQQKSTAEGRKCGQLFSVEREGGQGASTLSHLGFQPVQKTPTIHVSSGFIWGVPGQYESLSDDNKPSAHAAPSPAYSMRRSLWLNSVVAASLDVRAAFNYFSIVRFTENKKDICAVHVQHCGDARFPGRRILCSYW